MKPQSTELMVGITIGPIDRRRQITIVAAPAAAGWRPEPPPTRHDVENASLER